MDNRGGQSWQWILPRFWNQNPMNNCLKIGFKITSEAVTLTVPIDSCIAEVHCSSVAILGQILRSRQILIKKRLYTEVQTNFEKFDKARRNPDKLAGPLSGRKVPFQDQGSPTIARGPMVRCISYWASDLTQFLSRIGYGLIWPARFLSGYCLWDFVKMLKNLSGQSYGKFFFRANFYPDRGTASKGAFRGPGNVSSVNCQIWQSQAVQSHSGTGTEPVRAAQDPEPNRNRAELNRGNTTYDIYKCL